MQWVEGPMLTRLRRALLILFLPRLVTWTADALEALGEDQPTLDALNPWQRLHLSEAAASAARVWDCWQYVVGRGRRVENLSLD